MNFGQQARHIVTDCAVFQKPSKILKALTTTELKW